MNVKYITVLLFLVFTNLWAEATIKISKTKYENRQHFKIQAKGYTAFYDIEGGGFSRFIDVDGNDWIAFKMNPWDNNPGAAAGGFRGLPNMVFQQEDGGSGHPGFNKCNSEIVSNKKIKTVSKTGKWVWEWTFTDTYAEIAIVKTDTTRGYWFLYEGPVAGKYDPQNCVWANDKQAFQKDLFSWNSGQRIAGNWQWASFGNPKNNYVFSLCQAIPDSSNDFYTWMGNSNEGVAASDGMIVFGFGRDKGQYLLKGQHKYRIGFQKINLNMPDAYLKVQTVMYKWIKSLQ